MSLHHQRTAGRQPLHMASHEWSVSTFYVDGIHAIDQFTADGIAYVAVTYFSLTRPPGLTIERRVLEPCVIRPKSALLWQDGGIARWLRQQSGIGRLHS